MLKRLLRGFVLALLRLYYPRIEVEGRENLPTSGAVMFVLNHPNGLLDPLLLIATTGRRVSFLAKNTFFNNPISRFAMTAFGALPVFRQRDAAGTATQERNEHTFARCRELLRDGVALALFPEGTTHSEPRLLALKSGAARIALGAEAANGWQLGLSIVPVGLWYQDKRIFRSAVLMIVGKPFTLADLRSTYAADPEMAVAATTERIAAQLGAVVFQAGNADLLRGLPVVVEWTIDHLALTARQRRNQPAALLTAFNQLATTDAPKMAALAEQAQRYARTVRMLGISDPWSPVLPSVRRWRAWALAALLVLAAPFALVGWLISYLPYRMSGVVASRLTTEDQVLGTIKLIVGAVLVGVGWLGVAALTGWRLGAAWGWALLVIAPLASYCALRWSEGWRELRHAAAASWLRLFHPDVSAQLVARRQALSHEIVAAVLELND